MNTRCRISSGAAGALPACLLIALSFGQTACAAVEKQATKEAAELGANSMRALVEELVPRFSRAAAVVSSAFERKSIEWTLSSEQRVVFRSFEAIRPGVRWRISRVVSSDVKAFVRAFEAGARDAERQFADPLVDKDLVARWLRTPKADRVFVAGAQQDLPVVEALRTQLEREGKTVFFYRTCARVAGVLCDSRTVGAFFGTAGTAVLAMSEASQSSRFVPHEVDAAVRLAASQTELRIFTPGEVLGNATQARIVEASVDCASSHLTEASSKPLTCR